MISPDQAKALALCAVPGQLSSGEMQVNNGRTVYDITVLPTGPGARRKSAPHGAGAVLAGG